MKYNRMLCWVRSHEKKELKEAVNGRLPLVFAQKYDDFANQICKGDYLVLSISRAEAHLNKLKTLLRSFKQYKFHFVNRLDGKGCSIEEFEILDEENAVSVPYDIEELFLEASEKINNIFQKRGISGRWH